VVLLSNGDGSFQDAQTFDVGSGPSGVAAADLDGNGVKDLVVTNQGDGTVSVLLLEDDAGTLSVKDQQTIDVGSGSGSQPYGVALADLNGDGRPDLATANFEDDTVTVLLADPDGTFSDRKEDQRTIHVGSGPERIKAADVDGDGHTDLVVANYSDDTVSLLL